MVRPSRARTVEESVCFNRYQEAFRQLDDQIDLTCEELTAQDLRQTSSGRFHDFLGMDSLSYVVGKTFRDLLPVANLSLISIGQITA
jgi:hypothetical protein